MADQSEQEFQAAYQLSHAIGAGGAGEVWLATQVSLGRLVVVKFIRPQMMADELSLKRFQREARVLSRLSHPHIVPVYEYGSRGGQPYLVMEYVSGGSLSSRLANAGGLDDLGAMRLAMQIADGLDCLHREGIVHRDIKPGNILIGEGGIAKLADFGLARHEADRTVTTQGPLMGTPHYVAPEVLLCADPSPRSDLYALGVVIYQMLAKRLPWPDKADIAELISQRVNSPADPLERYRDDLPRALSSLVNRLLIPDPERRPGSAAEVRQLLEELTEQSFGKLRGPSPAISSPRETAIFPATPAPPVSGPATLELGETSAPPRRAAVSRAAPDVRWRIGAALGLLTGMGLFFATTRIAGPFRLEACEVKPAARGLEVHYRTNVACPTAVRIAVAGAQISRIVSPPEPLTTAHHVTLTDLPEGRAVELAVLFPDGTSVPFSAQTLAVQARPLESERLPRRVRLRLTTGVAARLQAEAIPTGKRSGEAECEVTRSTAGPPGQTHVLELAPLAPRQAYEVRARILLDSGEERPLPALPLSSPLVQLLDLTGDVRSKGLPQLLETLERGRRSARDPATLAPIQRALESIRWTPRRDELIRVVAESRLDEELTAREKREIYLGLQDLRIVDRYGEAHGLPDRTGVEKLMPPDLCWGDAPAFSAGPPAAWTPFPRVEGLMPASEDHVNLWAEGPRLTDAVKVTLPVPPLEGMARAQLSLRVAKNRACAYLLESESFPTSLLVVPPTATVFHATAETMYHTVPVSWLKPGPMEVTLRLVLLPGFYRNPRNQGTVKYSDLRSNCPVPEELALHLSGNSPAPQR